MNVQIPSWLQWYKKPSYVDIREFSATLADKGASSPRRNSVESRRSTDVPAKLSLEKILKNQPCTLSL